MTTYANPLAQRRWMTCTDGVSYDVEVFPINGSKATFSDERNVAGGQIFFRRKLGTSLMFQQEFPDYWTRRLIPDEQCATIFIRHEILEDGQWHIFWTGQFALSNGSFDLDRCIFTVRAEVLDDYSCIMQKLNEKVNVLELPAESVQATIWPSTIMMMVSEDTTPFFPPFTNDQMAIVEAASQVVSVPFLSALCPADTITLHLFWSERITTVCVNGDAISPPPGECTFPGSNVPPGCWVHVPGGDPNCVTDGVTVWGRPPSFAWPWGASPIVVGPVTGPGVPVALPTAPPCGTWVQIGIRRCLGNSSKHGYFICAEDATDFTTFPAARSLQECTEYLLEKADCGLAGVRSDFFEWNPPGEAEGYVAGENYVTGEPNGVAHLFMIQKSDAIDPTATNPATKGELTLKGVLELMRQMFRVYWLIDDENYLRLEHWKHWTFPVGLDLTTVPMQARTISRHFIESLQIVIPRHERFAMLEALYEDFLGADITYSGSCVTSDEKSAVEQTSAEITTDIAHVVNDPTLIDSQGFVMVACDADNVVRIEFGALSGALATNAQLSWANLHRDFYTWDRYLPSASMNKQDTIFDDSLPRARQTGVVVQMCASELATFDPKKRVKTMTGQTYLNDALAVVESVTYNCLGDTVSLNLLYPF